jgi:hypothetical protein
MAYALAQNQTTVIYDRLNCNYGCSYQGLLTKIQTAKFWHGSLTDEKGSHKRRANKIMDEIFRETFY